MVTRTNRNTVTSGNPFSLAGIDRILPAAKERDALTLITKAGAAPAKAQ